MESHYEEIPRQRKRLLYPCLGTAVSVVTITVLLAFIMYYAHLRTPIVSTSTTIPEPVDLVDTDKLVKGQKEIRDFWKGVFGHNGTV